MLDRIDRKIISKKRHLITDVDVYKSQIEIRKHDLVAEEYTKTTLITLLENIKIDINVMHKEITYYEYENGKLNKCYYKENFNMTEIGEKVNQLFSKEKKLLLVSLLIYF